MRSIWLLLLLFCGQLCADALPSWNEGAAKTAILEFVKGATDKESPDFIPVDERLATFDQDGTIWVEQPFNAELFFIIDRLKSFASEHAEWKNEEPWKSVIEGNIEIFGKLSPTEVKQLFTIANAGMTLELFHQEVNKWIEKAIHPRFKRPFSELTYQPMMELMQYLRDNQFAVYIVSGSGQEFIRAFSEKVYKVPVDRVIGTAGVMKYIYQNMKPVLLKTAELLFINDMQGKPEAINLIIGKRPVAAFGNSVGDRQMLEWAQASTRKSFELLVRHDDPEREYAYDKDVKIGAFSDELMQEAQKSGWTVVSMKNDWKVIFSER